MQQCRKLVSVVLLAVSVLVFGLAQGLGPLSFGYACALGRVGFGELLERDGFDSKRIGY